MALRHDLTALLSQLTRPKYGRELYFAGTELPKPQRVRVAGVRCLRYPGDGAGTYVHFHGGAFVTRYPQMDDFWARFVVARTGCTVLLPDYDVAPQARYPVAHEQAYAVVAAQGAPTTVGGFSGGGNLAASVALRGAENLVGQLLGVPSVDVAEPIADKVGRAPAGMIGERLLTIVRETYFRDAARRAEPAASPLRAPDLTGLVPAFVVTGERDTLRWEGERYAQRLVDAGVPVEHVVAPGVDHYFLHGAGPERARALMERMAAWIGDQHPSGPLSGGLDGC